MRNQSFFSQISETFLEFSKVHLELTSLLKSQRGLVLKTVLLQNSKISKDILDLIPKISGLKQTGNLV